MKKITWGYYLMAVLFVISPAAVSAQSDTETRVTTYDITVTAGYDRNATLKLHKAESADEIPNLTQEPSEGAPPEGRNAELIVETWSWETYNDSVQSRFGTILHRTDPAPEKNSGSTIRAHEGRFAFELDDEGQTRFFLEVPSEEALLTTTVRGEDVFTDICEEQVRYLGVFDKVVLTPRNDTRLVDLSVDAPYAVRCIPSPWSIPSGAGLEVVLLSLVGIGILRRRI